MGIVGNKLRMKFCRQPVRATIIFALCILLLAGCGFRDNGSGNVAGDGRKTEKGETRLSILTSFYPVYLAVINVTKDVPGVAVKNMTEPQTGCLHDYSLKPQDLTALENADVFVINGAGMESFLADVIERRKDLVVIEASKGIPLLKDEDGEDNPHVWVSVTNAITYVNNIAGQLAGVDPVNADKYMANAAEYVKKLEELREEMHNALDGIENRDIITFHEAFPYFAQEFDLNIVAVIEREPGTEPTPAELADIIKTVKETGVRALFAEPQYSSRSADTIARETGAKVYTLDPVVTGEAVPDAFDAYINAMRKNKETLVEALR